MTDITAALQELTARVQALESENAELRASGAPPAPSSSVTRRGLLRLGGVAAAAGAGAVMLRPSAAHATTGDFEFGTDNDAGTDATTLTSSSDDGTLDITNSGEADAIIARQTNTSAVWTANAVHGIIDGEGAALRGEALATGIGLRVNNADSENGNDAAQITQSGLGRAVYVNTDNTDSDNGGLLVRHQGLGEAIVGWVSNPDSSACAVKGTTDGNGPSIWGHSTGNGPGVRGFAEEDGRAVEAIAHSTTNGSSAMYAEHFGKGRAVTSVQSNPSSNGAATVSRTVGNGPGIDGLSEKGEGGRFTGKTAQIRLVPSTASTHPGSGQAGQLFVDKSNRLWFCKGGSSWTQLA